MHPQKTFRVLALCGLALVALLFGVFHSSPESSARSGAAADAPAGQGSAATATAVNPLAAQTLSRLRSTTGQQIAAHASSRTGVYDFVRVSAGGPTAVLVSDNPLASPESRARAFLSSFGGLVGMTDVERRLAGNNAGAATTSASALQLVRATTDRLGMTHVKFDQTYMGMRVLGGQVVVHLSAFGVKGFNGNYVPGVKVGKTPKVTAAQARTTALASLRKSPSDSNLRALKTELGVYHEGLLEGRKGRSHLAHAVTVINANGDNVQVWVDAKTGDVLNQISLTPHALYRLVFNKSYNGNDSEAIIEEGNPLKPALPLPPSGAAIPPGYEASALYHYAGQTYNLFASAFGRDSFDGLGSRMRTVLIYSDDPVNDPTKCPNATWNGATTNYCTEVTSDDVVSHEWGHAYTQYTHDLIYSYQSGALNESYSDIYGETLDLLNGHDAEGGTNNAEPTAYTVTGGVHTPSGGGQRWRVGEDVQGLNIPAAGILRDMWTPTAFSNPDSTASSLYHCDASDGGGVHANSGIPNHAFAMLVDGKTFNGVTVQGIGLTRALNIYYRAAEAYQVSSSNFADHEQALVASCNDLIGAPLTVLSTTAGAPVPSADVITAATCQQVQNAMDAVQMDRDVTAQCGFEKLLDPVAPEECDGSANVFTEDWETGMDGWTVGHQGTGPEFPGTDWVLKSDLPADPDTTPHEGTAAFAINPRIGEPNGGTCQPGGDVTGRFWIDSPAITVPANGEDLKLAFEHFVQTELEYDGGNVKVSVNGGAFNVIPQDQYVFNAPNFNIGSNNPMTDQFIWNGANEGELSGSWGTTIANLSNMTSPGDTIRIRFEFGQDACNGNLGWFVDTVRLYSCPFLAPPALSLGADYGNPDRDGRYTLNWVRGAGATGPDVVQESTSCGPAFTDDAGEPLVAGANAKWAGSEQWTTQVNPDDNSTAYFIPDGALQDESLTLKGTVTIPAGASAALTFTTRQGFEDGYDFGRVEVSTNGGTNFVEVASYTGPGGLHPAEVFEGLRTVNLTQFAGQTIKLRFRVTSDEFSVGAPAGWYVDNINVTASAFHDVATVSDDSYTFAAKPDGNYCYRVSNGYDTAGGLAQSAYSNVVNVSVSNVVCLTNVAAAANGGTATASSTSTARNYAPSGAIDGDRKGLNWEAGGGWNDATRDQWPDSLEVAFQGGKRLRQVNVVTLQDNFTSPQEPTPLMTTSYYGLLDFEVQYLDGEGNWVTLPGGNITDNNLVMRTIVLDPLQEVTTTKIRVFVHDARGSFSRIVEVEAIGCDAQP